MVIDVECMGVRNDYNNYAVVDGCCMSSQEIIRNEPSKGRSFKLSWISELHVPYHLTNPNSQDQAPTNNVQVGGSAFCLIEMCLPEQAVQWSSPPPLPEQAVRWSSPPPSLSKQYDGPPPPLRFETSWRKQTYANFHHAEMVCFMRSPSPHTTPTTILHTSSQILSIQSFSKNNVIKITLLHPSYSSFLSYQSFSHSSINRPIISRCLRAGDYHSSLCLRFIRVQLSAIIKITS